MLRTLILTCLQIEVNTSRVFAEVKLALGFAKSCAVVPLEIR